MRKLIIAVASVAFTVAAQAQEAFQCANPDVLNSLVFNARAESKLVVRRGMPDLEGGFKAPAGFTLIGSGVRGNNVSTVVAHKTELDRDKAFDSLLSFLFAEGWRREAPQGQAPTVTVAGPAPTAARLCRNGERRNMLVQEIEGIRYSTVFAVPTNPPRACNVPAPQQNFGTTNPMADMMTRQASMPQFAFPATTRMSAAAGPGSNFDNGNGTSSSTRIESPDSAAALADLLAQQLVTQKWNSDAQWNGALSTGSMWTRKGDDGKTLWGTLEILSLGKGIYDVGFGVSSGTR